MPMREKRGGTEMTLVGRDHNPSAFTLWMAGAGVKPGFSFGETDPIGYTTAETPVRLRELHAALLHRLGFDAHALGIPFQGLDQRLVGVLPSCIIHEVLA